MDSREEQFRRFIDGAKAPVSLYGLLALMVLLLLTDGYDTQSIGYVAPALVKAWGVKSATMGPVFSIGLLGVMMGAFTTTTLADGIGARRVLLWCTAVYGLLTLATVWAANIPSLMLLRFLAGVALGGTMPNAIALVSDYSPTRLRATMVTLAVMGFTIGGLVGALVAALTIGRFGWQAVFVIGAATPLLLLPVLMATLPESLARVLAGKAGPRALHSLAGLAPGWTAPPLTAEDRTVGLVTRPSPITGLFAEGFAGSTLLIWVVFFMNLLLIYTLASWLPTIMTSSGLSLQTANFAASFYQLGGTLGALLIAYLCDRFSARRTLPVVFLGAAASVFMIGVSGVNPPLLLASIAAAGCCVMGGQIAANAFVGAFYPAYMRATGIGWALGVGRMGSIIGPMLIGVLIAAGVQTKTLFQLCAIAGLFAALAIWLVTRDRRPAADLIKTQGSIL